MLILLVVTFLAQGAGGLTAYPALLSAAREAEVTRIVEGMSLEDRCGQLLLVSAGAARSVTEEHRALFRTLRPGGFLFFRFNVADRPEDVAAFSGGLQDLARESGSGVPLFVAVDHEGGTVYRLKEVATKPPDAAIVGLKTGEAARALYEAAAGQLAALGFSMNLAPILEPLNRDNRVFLRYRAFAADPELAAYHGSVVVQAMQQAGVLAVGKHFPGSGDGDPHDVLPRVSFDMAELENQQLLPFQRAIDAGVGGIMIAHVIAPAVDPRKPATVSRETLQGLLRGRLGFGGLIVTDDIRMKGLTKTLPPAESVVAAVEAGADLVIYTGDARVVHAALVEAVRSGRLSEDRVATAARNVIRHKLAFDLFRRTSPAARAAAFATFAGLRAAGDAALVELVRPDP